MSLPSHPDLPRQAPASPNLSPVQVKREEIPISLEELRHRAIVDLEEHRWSGGCCGISSMPLVDSISYCETWDSAGAETSVWKDDLAFGVSFALAVPDVDLRELAGAYPAAMIAAVMARLFRSAVFMDVDGSLLSRLSMIIKMSLVLIIPGGTIVEVLDVEAVAWLAAVNESSRRVNLCHGVRVVGVVIGVLEMQSGLEPCEQRWLESSKKCATLFDSGETVLCNEMFRNGHEVAVVAA
ncbi:predicted protein [Postia placenta Mad-698-R]|nr:predicted protein [Postia placenta Mad-698-R]